MAADKPRPLLQNSLLCAQQRTCQKVDEDFFKKMWTSRIIQTLIALVYERNDVFIKPFRIIGLDSFHLTYPSRIGKIKIVKAQPKICHLK